MGNMRTQFHFKKIRNFNNLGKKNIDLFDNSC